MTASGRTNESSQPNFEPEKVDIMEEHKAPVIQLFGQPARRLPEQKLDVSHLVWQSRGDAAAAAALDLTGRLKAYFVVGRGRVGKTTLLRWIAEWTFAGKTPRELVLAAVDQGNRLAH